MNANERFEYMADLFYKEFGFLAPGKDDPIIGGVCDAERLKAWQDWQEKFYSELFIDHLIRNIKSKLYK